MSHGPECTSGWKAGRKCHCAGCCLNFSTPTNFDKHRRNGECLSPVEAGLVLNKRGVYTLPGEIDYGEQFGR